VTGDPQVGDGHAGPDWSEDPLGGGRPSLIGVAVTLAGIALLAVLVLAIDPLRTGVADAIQGDTESLRAELQDLGFAGVVIVLALALVHAVVWYPAEILDAAAGYVYGFWAGAVMMMAGWIMNGVVAYWIGRHAARPLLYRFIGRERFLGYERIVGRGGVTLLLGMRLIPIVPFSLFSYVAGSARVPLTTFVWTSLRLPRQPPRGAIAERPDRLDRSRVDARVAAADASGGANPAGSRGAARQRHPRT
jgi:uncharacterized membrane protein YdjX (TVP38/TMEM64 family)